MVWGKGFEPMNLYGKGLKPLAFGLSATPTLEQEKGFEPMNHYGWGSKPHAFGHLATPALPIAMFSAYLNITFLTPPNCFYILMNMAMQE